MIENIIRLAPPKRKNGVSKYQPHQGAREQLRRRIGGFASLNKRLAAARKQGLTGTEV